MCLTFGDHIMLGAETSLRVSSKQRHQSWTRVLTFGSGSQQCKIHTEKPLRDIIKLLNSGEYLQTFTMTL